MASYTQNTKDLLQLIFYCEKESLQKNIVISDGQSSSQQHRKSSQISVANGKRPSRAIGKSLVGNTILLAMPLLTLIFDSTTPS